MPYAVRSAKVVHRPSSHYVGGQLAYPVLSLIRQKHRLGMSIQRQHVPGAIVLLVGPGLLVLSNHVILVIIYVNAAYHPNLGTSLQDLAIEIEGGLPIADQGALRNEPFERSAGAGINPGVVRIGVLRQIDV